MIGQRKQRPEYLSVSYVGVEDRRNGFCARGLEHCNGANQPARIGKDDGRGFNFAERQPVGGLRELAAEIHDLALAGGIDKNS